MGLCSVQLVLSLSLSGSKLMLMTLRPELVQEYLLHLSALPNLSHCFPEIPQQLLGPARPHTPDTAMSETLSC